MPVTFKLSFAVMPLENVDAPSTSNVIADNVFENIVSGLVVIPENVVTQTNFELPETSN